MITRDFLLRELQQFVQILAEQGQTMTDVDLAAMDRYWDEAKTLE